jgi:speckle-type POZ protein
MQSSADNWCRTELKITKSDLEWNVHVPCLETVTAWMDPLESTPFSAKETPDRLWKLVLSDGGTQLNIQLFLTSPGVATYYNATIAEPLRVKIAILNKKRQKVLQQVHGLLKQRHCNFTLYFPKDAILQSECQQLDGSLTFYCEIESYTKNDPVSGKSNDVQDRPISCSDQLIDQLEDLFENMKYADVTLNVGAHKFQAHKSLLASRSKVFAAMFEHATKEKQSNQVEIEDIRHDVFRELLRFIYTGRVSSKTMEKMATKLFFAADKYFLDQLKNECEAHLLRQMTSDNCMELLLLLGDEHLQVEHLKKEAVDFFRLYPVDVMATDGWKKAKQVHPNLLCNIQEMVLRPPV